MSEAMGLCRVERNKCATQQYSCDRAGSPNHEREAYSGNRKKPPFQKNTPLRWGKDRRGGTDIYDEDGNWKGHIPEEDYPLRRKTPSFRKGI